MNSNPAVSQQDVFENLSIDGIGSPPLIVSWPNEGPVAQNWGDKLNPALIRALTGRVIYNANSVEAGIQPSDTPIFYVIGSSLSASRQNAVFWGSGFIKSTQHLQGSADRVFAVRGPLSRSRVVEDGGSPSLAMGDPALLLPLIYHPHIVPSFDVGIIQHFREAGIEPLPALPQGITSRIIDITGGIRNTIDAVLTCDVVLSSSLHGLILAHAYGRKAAWLKISDRPMGDDFKFRDYLSSIGWSDYTPQDTRKHSLVNPLDVAIMPQRPSIDLFALIEACPFLSNERKNCLKARGSELSDGETIFSNCSGLQRNLAS